ncbi:hypothetical protein [Paractinoplanes durhamensis]|uniref:Uncharacterized protein n=1 Tax=Paractinoplanes durhamensis TaxID=113563 RepID=A0ABQ3YQ80_9ACTN|nr:hypothetical protein [Actinoplanes durhamensis]GID99730.1 hypothetical protein Adu01nite_10810 [Actinoplanes durhamensis]
MSDFSDWRDVKAKAREIDPRWDDADRVAQRALMREQMLALVGGARSVSTSPEVGPRVS